MDMQKMATEIAKQQQHNVETTIWHYHRVLVGLIKELHEDSNNQAIYAENGCAFLAGLGVELKKILEMIQHRPVPWVTDEAMKEVAA